MNQNSLPTGILKGVWTHFIGTDNWHKLLSGSYFKYWWCNRVKPLSLVTVTVSRMTVFKTEDEVPPALGSTGQWLGSFWSLFPSRCCSAVRWTGIATQQASSSWCSCCESACGLALSFYCYSNKRCITSEQWCSEPWWELVRAVITCDPSKIIVKLPVKTQQRESSLWASETPRFLASVFPLYGLQVYMKCWVSSTLFIR